MTVLSLPASMIPVRQRWQEEWKNIEMRSVFGSQILQPVPPVWATELEFDDRAEWLSGDIKALWMRLAGGNQLEAHYMGRPVPLGTMRGTLTLAADVAQGATSMQVVRANDNLLTNPEHFGFVGTGWNVGPNSSVAVTAGAPDGGNFARITTTSTANAYISRQFAPVVGQVRSVSVYYRGTTKPSSGSLIGCEYRVAGDSITRANVNFNSPAVVADGNWRRYEVSFTHLGPTVTLLSCYFFADTGAAVMDGWGPKINNGAAATPYGHNLTLLAGDLLGIGSGSKQQVVMVTQDATSTGQGNITVNFEHPLRNGFPAGTPVVWDKPKALFRLRQNRPGWEQERARVKGLKLDLIESVYA